LLDSMAASTIAIARPAPFLHGASVPEATTVAPVKVRYYLIDGLRGVASVMVVLHHFFNEGPEAIHTGVTSVLPRFVEWLVERGAAGVDIFFVISRIVAQ
jgi:peptidoglycan/LPS O-acetylase OafA/YrhL